MKRDLEGRLRRAEARRFVSPRVAAILRTIHAPSDGRPEDDRSLEPSRIFDPQTLTDAELDYLIAELKARIAEEPPN